ncbi:MAG: hypothetical protein AB1757_29150 [Acidobacteriota bacterium]
MKIILTVLISSAILILYSLIEKKFSQKTCYTCGAKFSLDDPEQRCPNCGVLPA